MDALVGYFEFLVLFDGVEDLLDDVAGNGPLLDLVGVAVEEAEPGLLDEVGYELKVDLHLLEADLIGVEIDIALGGEGDLEALEHGLDDGVGGTPDGLIGLDVMDAREVEGLARLHEAFEEGGEVLAVVEVEGAEFLNEGVDGESVGGVCHGMIDLIDLIELIGVSC